MSISSTTWKDDVIQAVSRELLHKGAYVTGVGSDLDIEIANQT